MPTLFDSRPRPPTRSRGRICPFFPSCRRSGRSATARRCHRSLAMTGGTTSRRTPTAPARSCSRSSSRASARCWSATPTGGASRSTRTTSIGSCRRGLTTRLGGAQLLFAGEIDVLQSPPPDQLERIAATPGLKVQKAESPQTLYLGFDQASPELRSSNVKGRNPFADRRVRQAFYQAHRHRAHRRGARWPRRAGRHADLAEGHRLVGRARPAPALRSREGQGATRRGRLP